MNEFEKLVEALEREVLVLCDSEKQIQSKRLRVAAAKAALLAHVGGLRDRIVELEKALEAQLDGCFVQLEADNKELRAENERLFNAHEKAESLFKLACKNIDKLEQQNAALKEEISMLQGYRQPESDHVTDCHCRDEYEDPYCSNKRLKNATLES